MASSGIEKQQAILVFRIGQLGDSLVALPALAAIRRRFAAHRLVLLTNRLPDRISSWAVLEPMHWFDRVVHYTPGLWTARDPISVVRTLLPDRFDHVFNIAPQRTRAQRWRDRLVLRAIARRAVYHADTESLLEAEAVPEWLRLLRVAEGRDVLEPTDFSFPIPEEARSEAQNAIASLRLSSASRLVAVAPGSDAPAKRWPEDRYREIGAALLAHNPDVILLVVGGPNDASIGERLCAAWGTRSHNLAGRLSIFGSAALFSRCAAFVGNDGGTMQLAGFAGTRCIAIFSARDRVGKWDPFGPDHVVLREDPPCAGCMLRVCPLPTHDCMTRIESATVLAAVQDVIAAPPRIYAA